MAVAEAETRVPPLQQAHRDPLVAVALEQVVGVLIIDKTTTVEAISEREAGPGEKRLIGSDMVLVASAAGVATHVQRISVGTDKQELYASVS